MSHNALLYFIASIVSFVISYYTMNRLIYSGIDKEETCTDGSSVLNEGDECHVWDGVVCRRGTVVNNQCVSEGSKVPLFFMYMGVFLLVVSVIDYFFGNDNGNDKNKEKSFSFSGVNGKYRNW